jgi:hypothetical protein
MTSQDGKSHDTCRCPRCAPREWLVADLLSAIRDRDDVVDDLVHCAVNILIYRDSERHREALRQALVGTEEVERNP